LTVITKGIRESVKNSVRSISAKNFYSIYGDIRDINWEYKISKIDNFISTDLIKEDISDYLLMDLDLKKTSNTFNSILKSGKIEYSLKNLNIDIRQVSKNDILNENDVKQKTRYLVLAKVDISIFLSGIFEKIPPLTKTLEVETGISTRY
jgi:hypothetical protein